MKIVDQACMPLPQCIREMVPILMAGLRWSFIFGEALHHNNTDGNRCSIRVIRYVKHYKTADLQCKIKQAIRSLNSYLFKTIIQNHFQAKQQLLDVGLINCLLQAGKELK